MKHLFLLAGTLLATSLTALGQVLDPVTGQLPTPAPLPPAGQVAARPPNPASVRFARARRLTEINLVGGADAYPWLSPDGLRLYYTQDSAGRGMMLRMASRPTPTALFGSPRPVPGLPQVGQFVCARLSPDELTVYLMGWMTSELWQSTRPSLTAPFNPPVQVALTGLPPYTYNLNGPSLSTNQQELYLNLITGFPSGSRACLLHLIRTGPTSFAYQDTLSLGQPNASTIGCLFGQDEHYLYYSPVAPSANGLFVMHRAGPSGAFGLPEPITLPAYPTFISDGTNFYQPTVDQLVVARLEVLAWSDNDLWLMEDSDGLLSTPDELPTTERLTLAPNPARGEVHLQAGRAGQPAVRAVRVLDALGRPVQSHALPTGQRELTFSVARLPAGVYTVRCGEQAQRLVVE